MAEKRQEANMKYNLAKSSCEVNSVGPNYESCDFGKSLLVASSQSFIVRVRLPPEIMIPYL